MGKKEKRKDDNRRMGRPTHLTDSIQETLLRLGGKGEALGLYWVGRESGAKGGGGAGKVLRIRD